MVDKMKINSRESGMALVFAIGLLALLLAVGIAFVGNSVNSRRAAENNSARTQARMLAMSALSRAASSIMIHAHQYGRDHNDELPENFNHLYSVDSQVVFTDGLIKKSDSDSLMQMPLSGAGLSKTEAMLFNDLFKSGGDWKGNWVFFRDGSHTDNRILGRAAWQVIGSSAGILAPVFFRGHLKTIDPKDDNLTANDRRWGREIDEVNLNISENDTVFSPVKEEMKFDSDDNAPKISSYDNIYTKITNASGDDAIPAVQRWIKKWFFYDDDENADAEYPSKVRAESFGHNSRSYMRFNISELWQGKYFDPSPEKRDPSELKNDPNFKYESWDKAYNVSASSDPWYARIGINNSPTTPNTLANSETAITRLTTDALLFDGTFDYEIVRNASTDGYSGLPFLRRIGDSPGSFTDQKRNKPTAPNKGAEETVTALTSLRRQIAANFNDYCDADSVPTSDVSADTWKNNMWGTDTFTHPSYTGNEKTPYLYEFGMNFGFVSGDSSSTVIKAVKQKDGTYAGKYLINAQIKAAPIVKLCNMYPFKLSDVSWDKLNAYVDFGQMDFEFKLKKVLLKGVTFKYSVADPSATNGKSERTITCDILLDELNKATLQTDDLAILDDALSLKGRKWKTVAGGNDIKPLVFESNDVDNDSGQKPYSSKYSSPVAPEDFWQALKNDDTLSTAMGFAVNLNKGDLFEDNGSKKNGVGNLVKSSVDSVNEDTGNVTDLMTALAGALKDDVSITAQPAEVEIQKIIITKISYQPQRIVLTATEKSSDPSTPGAEFGIDYVKELDKLIWDIDGFKRDNKITPGSDGADDNDILTLGGTQGILLSGYRNIDPRQNLNKDDWYDPRKKDPASSDQTSDNIREGMFDLVKINDLKDPTGAFAGDPDKVLFNKDAINYHVSSATNPANNSSTIKDWETVTEPAYKDDSTHISTAIIRNAPMMSPWEIGFIHRGVKWQTLNIKNAHADANGSILHFGDNGNNWDNAGTSYDGGDGAILDQIKMVDQSNTYGKINVNLLHPKHLDFHPNDRAMVQALFQGVKYGENPWKFIAKSTRDSNGQFPAAAVQSDTGTAISAAKAKDIAENQFFAGDTTIQRFGRRSQFLNYTGTADHRSLESGFDTDIANQQKTDASQEEIIGKTINLLSAEKSTPHIVEVTVVAQSIKDVEGTVVRQVNAKSDDDYKNGSVDDDGIATKTDCAIGTFDMYEHETNDDKNVYFDEITGEVKMRATFIFDSKKIRLRVGNVDYL